MATTNRFELDIAQQPDALRAFAATPLPSELGDLDLDRYDRIVLTGMGASHFAGHPTWCALAGEGRPAWWVSTAQLLALPELITSDSLLWVTSQSGESGEVVALVDGRGRTTRPRTLLATTNAQGSALAAAADIVVTLQFGTEATVSTKSYVTTLAAHDRALGALRHEDDAAAVDRVLGTAEALGQFSPALGRIVSAGLSGPRPRFVFIAGSCNLASALIGALLLKEVAKFPAEGYLSGEFRHGPLEVAGPGLTAVFFGQGTPDPSLIALSEELERSGALVAPIDAGDGQPASPWTMTTGGNTGLSRLVCSAKLSQLLSVALARALDIEPGEFRFGEKITASL